MTRHELIESVNTHLEKLVYKKRGMSWYKESLETVTVFALDVSKWKKDSYYIYLCVNFRAINDERFPKFYKCNGKLRSENLDKDAIMYLDLESNIDENKRRQLINLLLDKCIKILIKMETVSSFKMLLKEINPRLFMLSTTAQEYLNIKV